MIRNQLKAAAGFAVAAALGISATVVAGERETRVVYKGDDSARGVCMSIVRDDVSGLRRAFRRGRADLLEQSHLVYECNNMRLDEFAFTQNAQQTHGYLAPLYPSQGRVTVEQVSGIGQ